MQSQFSKQYLKFFIQVHNGGIIFLSSKCVQYGELFWFSRAPKLNHKMSKELQLQSTQNLLKKVETLKKEIKQQKSVKSINKIALIIVLFFVVISIFSVFITPVLEAPDEISHIDYINFISTRGHLTNQYVASDSSSEGHQPPLYYFIGSLIVRLTTQDNKINITPQKHPLFYCLGKFNAVPVYLHNSIIDKDYFADLKDLLAYYSLRLMSVLFGAITLVYAYKTSKKIFGNNYWSLLPLLFIACLPQFIFISGAINNDTLLTTFCAMIIFI